MYNNLIACINPPPPDKMKQIKARGIISVILQKCSVISLSSSVLITTPDTKSFAKLIKLREFLPQALQEKNINYITIAITGTNKRTSFPINLNQKRIKRSCDHWN